MLINKLIDLSKNLTSSEILKFSIGWSLFENENGRKLYNKLIRENVAEKFGVYIWCNSENNEIYYIGMAGKVKTDSSLSNHSLQKKDYQHQEAEIKRQKKIFRPMIL